MISDRIIFKIDRCVNEKRRAKGLSDCYSEEEIDEYIRDLEINPWYVQENINYRKFDSKPVFQVQDQAGMFIPQPNMKQ